MILVHNTSQLCKSTLLPAIYQHETYEGKSLNNKNFIITFLQEYLQKLFVSYFTT